MALHNQKRNYARRRIQRAFLEWFAESRFRFAVPLKIVRRTKHNIQLEFVNAQSMIRVTLCSWEIYVWFEWQGEYWDGLIDFMATPELTDTGYVCSLCDPEMRKVYPSREALWCDHMFEPFLAWANGTLVKAPWVKVYGDGGCTYAELRVSRPEDRTPDIDQEIFIQIIDNPLYTKQDSSLELPIAPKT